MSILSKIGHYVTMKNSKNRSIYAWAFYDWQTLHTIYTRGCLIISSCIASLTLAASSS